MSQNSAFSKTLARFNESFSSTLVRLWPEENKAWGLAFASELSAIDSPQTQFRWLLGGTMLLARASVQSFLASLRRPIGVGPAGKSGGGFPAAPGRHPRLPRFVQVLLLLTTAGIFAQPGTRAVFRSISDSYTGPDRESSPSAEVRRIQYLAENSQDPQLLAFVSLSHDDESKRLALAEAAIQRDPSLAWIDYENGLLPFDNITTQHGLPEARIQRLIAADPGNAALYLMRAESVAAGYRVKDAQADPQALDIASWGTLASRDPAWLADMHAAFSAPRYDPYDGKFLQLAQDVMRRYAMNDPRILASLAGRRPLYVYPAIRNYSRILLSDAAKAQRAGNPELAIEDCSLVLSFAQRIRPANFFRLEAWTANEIEAQAYPLLQSLYEKSGRHSDALALSALMEKNRAERNSYFSGFKGSSRRGFPHWTGQEWSGLLMQTSVLAIWTLLPLSLLSIGLLASLSQRLSARLRHWASLFADFCPGLLVLACAVLFLAYSPYDRAYRQMLQDSLLPARYLQFFDSAYAPFALPPEVRRAVESLSGPQGEMLVWSALVVVLLALLIILGLRKFPSRAREER